MKINAAVIQFDIELCQVEKNLARAEQLIRQAAAAGAELVMLPELWSTGFAPEQVVALAEDSHGPSLSMIKRLASQLGLWIIGGSIVERKQSKVYNTTFVVDPSGQVRAKYRKIHLFTFQSQEDVYFAHGEEWTLCEYNKAGESALIGLSLCYDLRFPELYRNMALRGAQILTAPSGWPRGRVSEFELFCRSRAAENRCYLLAANYSSSKGGNYPGNSLIISPQGDILAKLGNCEGFALAELDMDLFINPHWSNSLADRQPFIDEIDDNLL